MELIKHECGVAMVRLLKPLSYYKEKYGTEFYGLDKLYLMMEKEHNRGQEGTGVGCVKLNVEPGREYIFRERCEGNDSIRGVFDQIGSKIEDAKTRKSQVIPFCGEVYMGHLRYSTTGRSGISYVHPFLRRNNWISRNMLLCGNFNMTNVDEIFNSIIETGQHPRLYADTFILLEQLGHALDRENERLYRQYKEEGYSGLDLSGKIADNLNVANLLKRCAPIWDGGYVICGIVGNGDMWALRDPNGIRPAFYYADDEIIVLASERPVIQTALHLEMDEVKELPSGCALIVNRSGKYGIERILKEGPQQKCSFERIYFSRGSDCDIYQERKALGCQLANRVLKAIDNDIDNAVFSFIPNTAEVAFYGLMDGMKRILVQEKVAEIKRLAHEGKLTDEAIERVIFRKVRSEKVALKDIKLRTFIAEGASRDDLAAHVYDITYGTVRKGTDTLVVIDDSIVRGTTLRQSIISILDRLGPKKIVIVSSSPQVRFPDCYGIDMSRLGEFISFRAAMQLLKDRGRNDIIENVYHRCKAQQFLPKEQIKNYVKEIYAPFSDEEISRKSAEMLTPAGTKAKVEIVYQSLRGMHEAIPRHTGDWYFSGNYPTPGGNRLVNNAFINYYEGNVDKRD